MNKITIYFTDKIKTFVNNLKTLPKLAWVLIIAASILGILIRGVSFKETKYTEKTTEHIHIEETQVEWWTCSMHPQIKLPEPGQCPICFMDLIPLETSTATGGPRELKMSNAAMALAEIKTTIVTRDVAHAEIRVSGKVEYDETKLGTITAWVPGRLEHLFVDYTGISVKKGEHLVEIYSPELYSAQEELIQTYSLVSVKKEHRGIGDQTLQANLEAAREKLRLLGLNPEQIQSIEKRGTPSERITIYSPMSGVVIHKHAVEGMYVSTGTNIYTIADLSRVWVILDVYESDLYWLNYGQKVEFTVEALPGEVFTRQVAFIDPSLDTDTRTVKVRLNIANPQGKLKPGMFVRAVIHAMVDSHGNTVNPELAGKWVSPMHPEIVKDHPGTCDICGMPLVPAEKLGIVKMPAHNELPLLIPASAVLLTGKRAVVYVKVPEAEEPTFEGREVQLGVRAGDYYIVKAGLREGEEVVTNGNFKIDSAMQLSSKPSMMNPKGRPSSTGPEHPTDTVSSNYNKAESKSPSPGIRNKEILEILEPIYSIYFSAQSALANDDFTGAQEYITRLRQSFRDVDLSSLEFDKNSQKKWKTISKTIQKSTKHVKHWSSVKDMRPAFEQVSNSVLEMEKWFGHAGTDTLYEVFCPMAFDNQGATWLQKEKEVKNPFFGSKMLRCGEIKSEMKPVSMTVYNMEHESHE
ncbi:MAG: efflux RND transporter periplasmic adaptor subunit [Candidatus Marinimicrobia bacterium]|nr:efflux RND transporter periplasmic adaptor subunit [Candidatus Neomarinimicrobiota bacterium]